MAKADVKSESIFSDYNFEQMFFGRRFTEENPKLIDSLHMYTMSVQGAQVVADILNLRTHIVLSYEIIQSVIN